MNDCSANGVLVKYLRVSRTPQVSALWQSLVFVATHKDLAMVTVVCLLRARLEKRGSLVKPCSIHTFGHAHACTTGNTHQLNQLQDYNRLTLSNSYGKSSGCCVHVCRCVCLLVCVRRCRLGVRAHAEHLQC